MLSINSISQAAENKPLHFIIFLDLDSHSRVDIDVQKNF